MNKRLDRDGRERQQNARTIAIVRAFRVQSRLIA